MVHIKKDGIILYIPRESYEADYKDNGWKIIETKREEVITEKQVIVSNEIKDNTKNDKNKKK